MKCLFVILFIFAVASTCLCARVTLDTSPIFNVVKYGAKGDGQTDDSQAFVKAWQDVCYATQGTPTLIIPEGNTFLLQPVSFQGPCKPSYVNVQLLGTIIAPKDVDAWKWTSGDKEAWIQFSEVSGLAVYGGGKIDGQGASWWDISKGDHGRPNALHFHGCQNLRLSNLTHINSPKSHISINRCNGSFVSDLYISAPAKSPNTDGIDISASSNIIIQHSTMETGDDCIAINGGSSFINITGVFCGPGHGISVGSLGKNGAYDTVEEVHVRNCTFSGTTNGARIKTWKGGSGFARKITYEDIILEDARNPVIIDQQYVDRQYGARATTLQAEEAVKVSDVTYRNFRGTSADDAAIQLNCDAAVPCTDIGLEGINITSVDGKKTYASCTNAQGWSYLSYPAVPCLR